MDHALRDSGIDAFPPEVAERPQTLGELQTTIHVEPPQLASSQL
jgi:hypothetical protein